MNDFKPVLTHGDITPSNFIFTQDGSVVVIDWEYFYVQDSAIDIGYLIAEIQHNIKYYANTPNAASFIQEFVNAYCEALSYKDISTLLQRSLFYQALALLRIARNEWLPPLERMNHVVQALTLLNTK